MLTKPRYAVVGSRTTAARDGRGEGVEVWRVDSSGETAWELVAHWAADNPSFLASATARGTFPAVLYAVHGDGHEVTRLTVTESGQLTAEETRSTDGTNPVHVVVAADGRWLLVVNHSGSVVALPLGADGRLGEVAGRLDLTGTPGPHRNDQPGPKPHQVVPLTRRPSPQRQLFLVPDKGLDTVFTIALDVPSGALDLVSATTLRQGSGPRHLVVDVDRATAYTIDELSCSVSVLTLDEAGGTTLRQIHSALDPHDVREFRGAEIEVAHDRRHLYASLRSGAGDSTPGGPGPDPLAVFAIAPDGGLTPAGWASSGGVRPRFFTRFGDGLLVAHERSDTIVELTVDAATGAPGAPRLRVQTGSPVCLVLI